MQREESDNPKLRETSEEISNKPIIAILFGAGVMTLEIVKSDILWNNPHPSLTNVIRHEGSETTMDWGFITLRYSPALPKYGKGQKGRLGLFKLRCVYLFVITQNYLKK